MLHNEGENGGTGSLLGPAPLATAAFQGRGTWGRGIAHPKVGHGGRTGNGDVHNSWREKQDITRAKENISGDKPNRMQKQTSNLKLDGLNKCSLRTTTRLQMLPRQSRPHWGSRTPHESSTAQIGQNIDEHTIPGILVKMRDRRCWTDE